MTLKRSSKKSMLMRWANLQQRRFNAFCGTRTLASSSILWYSYGYVLGESLEYGGEQLRVPRLLQHPEIRQEDDVDDFSVLQEDTRDVEGRLIAAILVVR